MKSEIRNPKSEKIPIPKIPMKPVERPVAQASRLCLLWKNTAETAVLQVIQDFSMMTNRQCAIFSIRILVIRV